MYFMARSAHKRAIPYLLPSPRLLRRAGIDVGRGGRNSLRGTRTSASDCLPLLLGESASGWKVRCDRSHFRAPLGGACWLRLLLEAACEGCAPLASPAAVRRPVRRKG